MADLGPGWWGDGGRRVSITCVNLVRLETKAHVFETVPALSTEKFHVSYQVNCNM